MWTATDDSSRRLIGDGSSGFFLLLHVSNSFMKDIGKIKYNFILIIKLISDWLYIVRYRNFRSVSGEVNMSAILFCKHGFHKKSSSGT